MARDRRRAISLMALEHSVSRIINYVAFCGEIWFNWARSRGDDFGESVKQLGLNFDNLDIRGDRTKISWAQ